MQASRKINKKSKKFYIKSPQLNIKQSEVFTLLLEEHMYTFVRDKNIIVLMHYVYVQELTKTYRLITNELEKSR
jgi:hypothetical protein